MRHAALITALLLLPTAARADDFGRAYEQVIDSVVYITAIDTNWNYYHGTGVVVGANMVLTAYHVVGGNRLVAAVPAARNAQGTLITDVAHYSGIDESRRCRVIARDAKRDLALLEFTQTPNNLKKLKMADRKPGPGSPIFTIGSDPAQSMFHFASGNVRQLLEASYRFADGQTIQARCLEVSVPINPGDSGGPIINAAGELVGINSATVTGSNQVHYGINVAEVLDFLMAALEEQQKRLQQQTKAQ